MPFFETPGFVPSLRDARYWSLDWIAENSIQGPFAYVVLLKADGGYRTFGQFATATEAFAARRELVAESGNRSYFLRAVRIRSVEVVGPGHPDSREDLDRYRDALATCDDSLIAPEELSAFRQWAAKEIEDRPLYQPTSRVQHGEIPF
jgi:hypothetical protein